MQWKDLQLNTFSFILVLWLFLILHGHYWNLSLIKFKASFSEAKISSGVANKKMLSSQPFCCLPDFSASCISVSLVLWENFKGNPSIHHCFCYMSVTTGTTTQSNSSVLTCTASDPHNPFLYPTDTDVVFYSALQPQRLIHRGSQTLMTSLYQCKDEIWSGNLDNPGNELNKVG